MDGQGKSKEESASACQARCARTLLCAYFTFWPGDGGCHLQSRDAELRQSPEKSATQFGPRNCNQPDGPDFSSVTPPPTRSKQTPTTSAGQRPNTSASAPACPPTPEPPTDEPTKEP